MAVMAGPRRPSVLAAWVIAVAVAIGALGVLFAYNHAHVGAHAAGPPPNPGAYRVVPPPMFEGARLSAATGPRSAVWSDGITRFPGATPVTAVYDKDGKPWLYAWGAEGKLVHPGVELATLWQAFDPDAAANNLPGLPGDPEPTGAPGGYLQCQEVYQVCAWADYSGIVVVSPQPFGETDFIVGAPVISFPVTISEQGMAAMTLSFRGVAEHLSHGSQRYH